MRGQAYDVTDPQMAADKTRAMLLCQQLDAIPVTETEERLALIKELFGEFGEGGTVNPGFHCDNGKLIRIGKHAYINYNVSIMDRGGVTIGDNVLLAPNVVITTSNHPLDPKTRRGSIAIAAPVTIGNDVWIGAGAIILPGVTLGNNVVVAAGAVVTKDVGDNTIVAGVPARKIRDLDPEEESL